MLRLLFRFDKFDPSLGNTFTGYLLYLFKASEVVVLHRFFVTDHDLFLYHACTGIFIVLLFFLLSIRSLRLRNGLQA